MRLRRRTHRQAGGGVRAARADRLMKPFDLEIWFGERVAVLGSNGSGKSHFLRLLAAGGSDPDVEHRPVGDAVVARCSYRAGPLGARVRPGWFVQTHAPRADGPDAAGDPAPRRRAPDGRGRAGMPREQAARALDRYELAYASEQRFEALSGGQQARLQILLLELSGRDRLAARRAHRQSRRAVGRGAGGRAGPLRGDRAGRHPRPLVRTRLRPVPRVRRRRVGLRVGRAGLGRGSGRRTR
jgi:hypothetical protein